MFSSIFLKAINETWPMLFIFSVILCSIRIIYIMKNNEKFVLYKEFLMLLFIVYILLLYYVVTFQDNNYGINNFVPFKEIFRYNVFSSVFLKNIVGNIVLFIPFGLYVSLFLKVKKVYIPLVITFLTSISIEFAQYKIGRTADIDDIILNVCGGIVGYLLYLFFKKISGKLPNFLKSDWFLNLLMICVFVVIALFLLNFKFWGLIK